MNFLMELLKNTLEEYDNIKQSDCYVQQISMMQTVFAVNSCSSVLVVPALILLLM